MSFDRRNFSRLSLAALTAVGTSSWRPLLAQQNALISKAIEIEQRLGARLGLAVLDEESGRSWNYQSDQRFPLCSTFKVVASGAFLARVDRAQDSLERRVVIEQDALVDYSPVTETRVGEQGMTMAEICAAALTESDNTAGNIILQSIGGPSGVTQFARSLGDNMTRLDRWETDLNEALIGDPRDTTTPAALTSTLRELLLSDTLSENSRKQLRDWMIANKTGAAKLRAGFPSSWIVGDKTGGGNNGTMADVAVVWPENRQAIFVAIYMTETTASFDDRNAGIAEIARALTGELQ
ncbi:MAG: class A beta-lactamase [Pseudohongiellaceae bacterium]